LAGKLLRGQDGALVQNGTEVLLLFVSKSPAYYEIARMLHRVPAFTN
jgi:hypothetical protein